MINELKELYKNSDSVKLPLNKLFNVKCIKCNSENIELMTEESCYGGSGGGCESCGYGGDAGSWKFWLALKCMKCGNAKVIFKEDEY